MRTFIITLIALCNLALLQAHDVELRFTNNTVIGDKLYIDVEMRASSYEFSLADHNIRAYYDNTQMRLNAVEANRPDLYSTPKYNEVSTNGQEIDINRLPFDDHMTFVNLSVLLNDKNQAGEHITTEWTALYTMEFELVNESNDIHLAWAMEGVTDAYATAFVQVSEWLGPNKIQSKNVFDLVNWKETVEKKNILQETVEVSITPNPASEYLKIAHDFDYAQYTLIDMSGSIVLSGRVADGERIAVSDMASGSYVLMVEHAGYAHTEQVIIK